jgi:hypothetical protein
VSPRSCPAGWPSMVAASPTLGFPKPSPGTRTRVSRTSRAAVRALAVPQAAAGPGSGRGGGGATVPALGAAGRVPCGVLGAPLAGAAEGRHLRQTARIPGLKRPFNVKGRGWAGVSAPGSLRLRRQAQLDMDSPSRLRGKGPSGLNMERIGAAHEAEDHRRLSPRVGRPGILRFSSLPLTQIGAPAGRQINRVSSAPGDQSKRSIAGATRSR